MTIDLLRWFLAIPLDEIILAGAVGALLVWAVFVLIYGTPDA